MQENNIIFNIFQEVFSRGNFSEAQKLELFTKLEGAIVSNIISQALDRLSEENKVVLKEKDITTGEELGNFLGTTLSQEELKDITAKATEEVIGDFLERL